MRVKLIQPLAATRPMDTSCRQLMPYLLFNLLYRKWGAATERLGQLVGFDRIGALARRAAYFIR